MSCYLKLLPRDPLIARDGRPFGIDQGIRMKSLDWPYPSVLAGTLRSLLGKLLDSRFSPETVQALKEISVAGPFPSLEDELYFPAPRDLLIHENDDKIRSLMPLRPQTLAPGEGCDLPHPGLSPMAVTADVKPADAPAFWSSSRMSRWLTAVDCQPPPQCEEVQRGCGFLNAPAKAARTHVQIDADRGVTQEGRLFTTVGLDFALPGVATGIALAARIEAQNPWNEQVAALNTFHPFGGERRLLHWQAISSQAWNCPESVRQALTSATRVRLVLATPALFADGWKPGWLDENLQGQPPGISGNFTMTLVGACIGRWLPLSGWSLEAGKVGPKPVQRLVPAGSVYFFELTQDSAAEELADQLWLRSVADGEPAQQIQRDGFGLALWGIWEKDNE